MADERAIGIFDSGLGGLTVTKEIIKALPKENIIYFGDTGRVPYGTRSPETIRKYAVQDELFLLKHNVKLIVAACGTVSSVAADTGDTLPVPFIEVVSHSVKAAVNATKTGKIGVLGTSATINSGAHRKALLELMPEAEVTEGSGTLLVPLVEAGWYEPEDTVVTEILRRYLEPFIEKKIDTLILGCTHFPILAEAISKIMGNDVILINMGVAAAAAVKHTLELSNALNSGGVSPERSFFVSDMPESFRSTAGVLLGDVISENKIFRTEVSNI